MFGVMRIINLAHGDIAVLGAFLACVVIVDHAGVSPFLALVAVLPAMLVLGYVLQRDAARAQPARAASSCRC